MNAEIMSITAKACKNLKVQCDFGQQSMKNIE